MKKLFLSLATLAIAVVASGGPTYSVVSSRFVLDLRNLQKTITGRILGGGSPVPNADVVIYGPNREVIIDGKTDAGGNFSLIFTRKCDGLVFHASYNPYISIQQNLFMNASDTIKNLGDLILQPCVGNDVIILNPSDPANPAISEVETGGTAYRYYRVAVRGLDNRWYEAGSREVQLRVNSVSILQGTTNIWLLGKVTGRSDPDGLLRVEIPSSYLPFCGEATVELLYQGSVKNAFTVSHKPRSYDKTASHEISAGLSGHATIIKGSIEAKAAAAIENTVKGGTVTETTYTGEYGIELKLGLGAVSPGVKIGFARVGAEVTAGGIRNVSVEEKFRFPSGIVTDSDKTKLAYLLVEPALYALSCEPNAGMVVRLIYPALAIYKGSVVQENWEETSIKDKMGVYGEGEIAAHILNLGKNVHLGVDGRRSGSLQSASKITISKDEIESSGGVSANIEGSIGLGILLGEYNEKKAAKEFPMPNLFGGVSGQASLDVQAALKRHFSSLMPHEVIFSLDTEIGGSFSLDTPFIKIDSSQIPLLGSADMYAFDVTYSLSNFTGSSAATLYGEAGFWAGVSACQMTIGAASLPIAAVGMFSTAHIKKLPMEFKLETGRKRFVKVDLPLGLGAGVGGEINLGGTAEQEASGLTYKGIYWEGKHYLNEAYPFTSSDEIPGKLTANYILEYWPYLANVVGEIVKKVLADIVSGQAVMAQMGNLAQDGGQAVVSFAAGAFSANGQFIGGYLDGVENVVRGAPPSLRRSTSGGQEYLPQDGASNYVYGVGNMYFLNASNTTLTGAGILSVQYSDAMAEGLDESTFRLYRKDDASNIWTLVSSSFAYPVSNTVSGTITQLGCYAVAPAMPAGEIFIAQAPSPLMMDGVSTASIALSNLLLNTGLAATQAWLYTVTPEGLEILTSDADTNRLGHQIVASNALASLTVRALQNATWARLSAQSVAGTAAGAALISILDSNSPPPVASLAVTAGQSRAWATWPAVTNQDVAGYRVYYRSGMAGPPYDGHAKVDGQDSPFDVATTNSLLAGLDKGSNYYIAVSVMDYAGHESARFAASPVRTGEQPPAAALGVSMRCDRHGSNVVMWSLSEDDGFNDRDVSKYIVSRAILPGGAYQEIAEVPAGFSLFVENSPALAPTQFARYAVTVVDAVSNRSPVTLASQFLPGGSGVDNDGDKMDDLWETARGLDPLDPTDAAADPDTDGWSNLSEFTADTDPHDDKSYLRILSMSGQTNGMAVQWLSGAEAWHYVESSASLSDPNANWQVVYSQFPPGETNGVQAATISPPVATGLFYRVRVQRQ